MIRRRRIDGDVGIGGIFDADCLPTLFGYLVRRSLLYVGVNLVSKTKFSEDETYPNLSKSSFRIGQPDHIILKPLCL